MMRPPPALRMCGAQARQQRNTPSVFTSITRRHSAASIFSKARRSRLLKIAALLTRMSMRPRSLAASAAMRATSASFATSTFTPSVFAPLARAISAAASPAPWMSAIAIAAPSAARRIAIALPMPAPPPVTIATLPWSLPAITGSGGQRQARILVAARAHGAGLEQLALADPLEGILEHFPGVGLEHDALARAPAPRVHLAEEALREFIAVMVRVELRPQIDVALRQAQRGEEFFQVAALRL